VEPDDPVGKDLVNLPSTARPDFLGIAPGEVPEELLGLEATASTSLPVVQSPVTYTPQDFWDIWGDLGDQQDAAGVEGNLLMVDPAVLVVTPAEFSPVALPVVDSPAPPPEAAASLLVGSLCKNLCTC